MFTVNQVFPGISHITDAMCVSFTLIEGKERALLFDTGYGIEDVSAFVGSLTRKPVTVFLSHGHHDHVLGSRWFSKTYLCSEDMEEFQERSGKEQRLKVMAQAKDQELTVPEDFLTDQIEKPEKIQFTESIGPFERRKEEIGSQVVQVIKVPGHTPGSIVMYIPSYELILTGDNWNPCTWMWFPTSDAADLWRDRMKEMILNLEEESGREIKHVICSHQPMMRKGEEMKDFLSYMTDKRMRTAPRIDMSAPINTHDIRNDEKGWQLIFDQDKCKKTVKK